MCFLDVQAALNADLRVRSCEAKSAALEEEISSVELARAELPPHEQIRKLVTKLQKSCEKRRQARTKLSGQAEEKQKMIRHLQHNLQRKHGKEEELSRTKIDLKTLELTIKDLTVRMCACVLRCWAMHVRVTYV